MRSDAQTVDAYLADLPEERREPIAALRSVKRHMALYMMGVYGSDAAWFRERWEATGRKLHMGKSCVRFSRLEDVPSEVVGEAIARTSVDDLIAAHERAH